MTENTQEPPSLQCPICGLSLPCSVHNANITSNVGEEFTFEECLERIRQELIEFIKNTDFAEAGYNLAHYKTLFGPDNLPCQNKLNNIRQGLKDDIQLDIGRDSGLSEAGVSLAYYKTLFGPNDLPFIIKLNSIQQGLDDKIRSDIKHGSFANAGYHLAAYKTLFDSDNLPFQDELEDIKRTLEREIQEKIINGDFFEASWDLAAYKILFSQFPKLEQEQVTSPIPPMP